MSEPLLLSHLNGHDIGRFPVWMMRQAGRYLPSYRKIREGRTFWDMVTNPKIAAEVSLQPIDQLGVDAVIFFSDILTLPYGQGIPIELIESKGPTLKEPLRDLVSFECFKDFEPQKHTPFVGQALSDIREKMPDDKTLIGFAGTPWTVGSYLIEGSSSKNYEYLKGWMYQNPTEFVSALEHLSVATQRYLQYQVESGAQAIQLFDSWLSEMPLVFFKKHYLPLMTRLFKNLKKLDVPIFYYTKYAQHLWDEFGSLPVDVLSVDPLLPLSEVERRTQKKFSLQGNLDSIILSQGTEYEVRQATKALVEEAHLLSKPAILNLGHGIFKTTPVENAKAFVEEAQRPWS